MQLSSLEKSFTGQRVSSPNLLLHSRRPTNKEQARTNTIGMDLAANTNVLFELEYIQDKTLTPQQAQIIVALSHCLQTESPDPAMETATMLNDLCPPIDAPKDDMEEFLWSLWDIMAQAAISPDSTGHIQECLVKVLQCLQTITRGDVTTYAGKGRLWTDLPMFAMEINAGSESPMNEMHNFDADEATYWLKQSEFAARCVGAGLGTAYFQGMLALRDALEEEQTGGQLATECRVEVACGWISHAGQEILLWARDNDSHPDPDDGNGVYIENGPLYQGPQYVCFQRWRFWQDGFKAIANGTLDIRKALQERAGEMVGIMKAQEARISNTL